MMESIYTGEYNDLAPFLPIISGEKRMLLSRIMDVQMQWSEEVEEQYPLLTSFGRPGNHGRTQRATPLWRPICGRS